MRTSKLLCTVACLAFLAAGVSCNKEAPGAAGNDSVQVIDPGRTCTVTFKLNNLPSTKAVTTGSIDDAAINRIDIFEYNGDYVVSLHHTLTAEELASKSFHLQYPYGSVRGYLVLANVSEAICTTIESLSISELQYQRFRLQDLFDGTHYPMVGMAYVNYTSDQDVSVDLRHYMYRVDVGNIRVNFDDESWMSKDVFVKNIALINVPATGYVAKPGYNLSDFGSPMTRMFGNTLAIYDETPIFGNLEAGYAGFETTDYSSSVSAYNPSTGSNSSVSRQLNCNVRWAAGLLNITATGALLTATYHNYNTGSGEGRVCSSTNPSQSHTLAVNKSFYGWHGCCNNGQYALLNIYGNQNAFPKLVVELSVDGVSYFYPIQMYYPQPNTVYSIEQITLKSAGSNYSNFYEKMMEMDMSISVSSWTDVDIANINAGYTDEHHTGIYN